jgi:hypothetical protein
LGGFSGPMLKAGSGSRFVTKGYYQDHADLMGFLQRFGATQDGMSEHWQTRQELESGPDGVGPKEIASVQWCTAALANPAIPAMYNQ